MGQLRVELADLSFKYVDPKRFNELSTLIKKHNKSAEKSLKRIEQEITEALNISRTTAYALMKRADFPSTRIGRKIEHRLRLGRFR